MEHFTAWITNDTTIVEGNNYEIDIFEIDEFGSMTGEVLFHATGTLPADLEDHDAIVDEARSIIETAGWELTGDITAVPSSYVVDVERA